MLKFLKIGLISNTLIYTLSTVVNSAIPFFLIPILTRYLNSSDYGIISIYTVLVAIVSPFIGYTIHGSITAMIFSDDKDSVPEYIGNCFYILFASTIITVLVFLFISSWIENQFKLPIIWVWSSILLAFNQFIALFPLSIWQAKNKPFYFGLFQISSTAINFSITLLLIIHYNKNWVGRLEAQLITSFIFAIISIIILLKNKLLKFRFKIKYFGGGIKFGVPLILHVIGGVLLSVINRFFIAKYVGLSEAGLFFLAFQLTSIINIFTSALNTAYVPWLFSKLELNSEIEKEKIVALTYKYFLFLIASSFLFAKFLPEILHILVGKDYYSAQKYFDWLIVGCISNGMYLMVTNYIVYAKKTEYLAGATFLSSLASVALNFVLIQKYGAIGASISNAIGFSLLFILTWILSSRVYKMPWFGKTA
jgi:O-antigen/teichoic acid export membrane protein